MKTGRADLDAMMRVTSIPAEEPTFLLRGQDSCGAETVRAWAEFQLAAGAPVAVIEQALQQADAMAEWPVKKTADASHLTGDEALQLKFQFTRRRWDIGHRDPAYLAAASAHAEQLAKLQPAIDFAAALAAIPADPNPETAAAALQAFGKAARLLLDKLQAAGLVADVSA